MSETEYDYDLSNPQQNFSGKHGDRDSWLEQEHKKRKLYLIKSLGKIGHFFVFL